MCNFLKAVLSLALIHATFGFKEDSQIYFPPALPKTKQLLLEFNEVSTHSFRDFRDINSGCNCKEKIGKWIVCFGKVNCTSFPRSIVTSSLLLRLKNTKLLEIKMGDFSNVLHLEQIEIEGNFQLEKIESGVFKDMKNLKNLSISYNSNLKVLEENVFIGLKELKVLYLVKNGFFHISHVAKSLKTNYLPKLEHLILSENHFPIITEDAFEYLNGSNIKELNIVLCDIEYIQEGFLKYFKKLTALRVGMNTFNDTSVLTRVIKESVKMEIGLKKLNLFDIGIRKKLPNDLATAITLANISDLTLSKNQFDHISVDTIGALSNVQLLELRQVLCRSIDDDGFKNLPNLRTLILSGNKLANVPPGILLQQLTYLDLSDNSGNAYAPSYFHVENGQFLKTPHLKLLDLSFNRIGVISNETFLGLLELRALGLRNASINFIERNAFYSLQNLLVLNLENNPIGRKDSFHSEIFTNLKSLEVLLLGGCSISKLSDQFSSLQNLKHLGLERNKIVHLLGSVFANLYNLRSLDVSQNRLEPWNERLFKNNSQLAVFIGTKNRLSYFSKEMLEDFGRLKKLKLMGNPFNCDCKLFNLINQSATKLIKNRTICLLPEQWSGRSVLEFLRSQEICKNETRVSAIVAVSTVACLLIIFTILALVYRHHLQYWTFLIRISLINSKTKRKPKPNVSYKYDAFVSYSNEDKSFVIRLVAMLENYEPFLKLCVYERDFEIGSVISEAVFENIASSRRTLLIVSDAFAKSPWCRWETHVAEHNRLFENVADKDNLVLIKIGPVSAKNMTPFLRYLLNTRIYLEWESDPKKQKLFWEKLRSSLSSTRIKEDS